MLSFSHSLIFSGSIPNKSNTSSIPTATTTTTFISPYLTSISSTPLYASPQYSHQPIRYILGSSSSSVPDHHANIKFSSYSNSNSTTRVSASASASANANDSSEAYISDFNDKYNQSKQEIYDHFQSRHNSRHTNNDIFTQLLPSTSNDLEHYSVEEQAILSLVEDHPSINEEINSALDLDIHPSSIQQLSHQSLSSHVDQSEPIPVNSKAIKKQIEAVRKRRKKIADQRGDSWHHNEPTTPQSEIFEILSKSFVQVPSETSQHAVDCQQLIDSVASASVVDLYVEKHRKSGSALTTAAHSYFARMLTPPRIYRTFPAMEQAFFRVYNPPCPRCKVHTPVPQLQNIQGICNHCYRDIFLQSRPMQSYNSDPSWVDDGMREEMRQREHELEQQAKQMTQQIRNGLTGEYPGTHPSSMPTFDVSSAICSESNTDTDASNDNITNSVESPSYQSDRSNQNSNTNNTNHHSLDSSDPPRPPPTSPSHHRKRNVSDGWNVQASDRSLRTINPIRNLVQNIDVQPNPEKDLIKLSVGDPTVYGNLKVSDQVSEAYCDIIRQANSNGYSMSMGMEQARAAVAERYSLPKSKLSADDVILASGTSGAIELAVGAIANEGDNILLPSPGFPLFRTIAEGYGVECRYYRVNPDKNWEIELADFAALADNRTRAIVVNNPSNPCGSVYSESHVEDLMAAASVLRLPVIADEVYADMVFSGYKFTPIASKSDDVPVISVGGISKQFVVPGWRLGWILVHDRNRVFDKGGVTKGIRQLTTRMLVPNTPAQAMIPTLLQDGVHDIGLKSLMKQLEANARFTMKSLETAKGVECIEPRGAMYVMAKIDVDKLGLRDDMEFTRELLREEAVFVLPGQCFQAPNFVRIVFCAPQEVLAEAFFRIRSFCSRRAGGM